MVKAIEATPPVVLISSIMTVSIASFGFNPNDAIETVIMVKSNRKEDFQFLLVKLEELLSCCEPKTCEAYLLIIPHACQVDSRYLEKMSRL